MSKNHLSNGAKIRRKELVAYLESKSKYVDQALSDGPTKSKIKSANKTPIGQPKKYI